MTSFDESWQRLNAAIDRMSTLARATFYASTLLLCGFTAAFVSRSVVTRDVPEARVLFPLRGVEGREWILIFVGSSTCGFSRANGLRETFATVRVGIESLASQRGVRRVSLVGVALDWSTDAGLRYLNELDSFDEVIVGRNSLNTGLDRYVRLHKQSVRVPQFILIERDIMFPDSSALAFGPDRLLAVHVGRQEIIKWAAAGVPVPALWNASVPENGTGIGMIVP